MAAPECAVPPGGVVPLKVALEWADSSVGVSMPLFRLPISDGRKFLRLDDVVFRRRDLFCDMMCPTWQVPPGSQFLPLDPLLARLVIDGATARSIFDILRELSSVLPLACNRADRINAENLLVTDLEARGFRLNLCISEKASLYAQIAWQAEANVRFHAATAAFHSTRFVQRKPAEWLTVANTGVSQLLARELRQLAGDPVELFSPAGLRYLNALSPL